MTSTHVNTRHTLPLSSADDARQLDHLRQLAVSDPDQARQAAWAWLQTLQAPSEHYRLHGLFAQGEVPVGPQGACEGLVMNLYGKLWLAGVDRLVRLGQRLGGVGWTGKTFDSDGTGYNRLTPATRLAALLCMPGYRFQRHKGELIGFHFLHVIEPSPLPPHQQVRTIRYDAPQHGNPLVLPRTRDEVVQIIPDVYLGRATLRTGDHWEVVGYFGLRSPQEGG
ncbi:hypothetical protein [Isoalcanivorax indicus]|uniref:hypothetical protein n=1 Tax=Isoalcanivorax indicus TaxID=2202653 RepID=UPI000DB927DC|nr:hypothetical protein [Isoalcanivorax indicus]